jgi:hypothetical protein
VLHSRQLSVVILEVGFDEGAAVRESGWKWIASAVADRTIISMQSTTNQVFNPTFINLGISSRQQ